MDSVILTNIFFKNKTKHGLEPPLLFERREVWNVRRFLLEEGEWHMTGIMR